MFPKSRFISPRKSRLSLAMDFMHDLFRMEVLDPTIMGKILNPNKYRATQLYFNMYKFHTLEKIQLHKKTGNMLSKYVLKSSMNVNKIQTLISKLEKQLKYKKRSMFMMITGLDNKLMEKGHDPLNPSISQNLFKEKYKEI